MDCPRCSATLTERKFKGIGVDRCPDCQGIWLDYHEMDDLEDAAAREDVVKGMRDYARRAGDLPCPHCNAIMDVFNYRANDLPIEHCPNDHGYWLDKGEEERVMELMRDRARDLRRSTAAEERWAQFLEGGSGSFLDKLKGLFGGR